VQVPYEYEERLLQPWEEHPRELVSWFDVLNFSAYAFFWCGSALRSIRTDCVVGSAICVEGNKVMYAMAQDIDAAARLKAENALIVVVAEFRGIGMTITADTAKELLEDLQKDERRNFQWLHTRIEAIEGIAQKEFRGKAFFYIPPERMKYWPTQNEPFAFGKAVASSFPPTTFDANSAGFCIATTLSTAAVFHLMRILEIGLTALGEKFDVSLAHTNWAPAIEHIESKIRDMHKDPTWKAKPDCKEQQEFYAQAASHFAILKDAWRNHTMHVRGKYTEDEAERIFENVKAFMQKLAERLAEDELIPYGKS